MYEATSYLILNAVFARIKPRDRSSNEVFLDVGCGMGRTVLAAATYPYAAVLGIEISEQLLEVARRNVARSHRHQQCGEVRLEHADASNYRVPDEVTTIFFYNPFHGEPMRSFMESTRQSLVRRTRNVEIVFVEPAHFAPAEYSWLTVNDEVSRYYPGREKGLRILFCTARL
jgi:SAM-dependent methyltransferase